MKTERAKTTEKSKNKKWGGVRKGAGRKKSENPKKTMIIRIDERLLPAIKLLKEQQQSGQGLENLFTVTANQDENKLQAELEQYQATGLKLVLERDKEHHRAIKLKTQCQRLQSDKKALTAQLTALQHQEHDCQTLTKNGTRCTRPAKLKTNWHGVEINSCLQHAKT